MDVDLLKTTKDTEITQFLHDVRDFFRASLESAVYANSSNGFYLTASELTEQLLHRCERLLEHLNVDVGHGSVGEVDQTSTVVDTTSVQPMKRNSISNHYENALPTTSVLRFNDLSGMPVNDEDLGLVPRSNRNVSADERCWTTTMGGIGDTNRHNSSTGHSDGTYLEMSASNSLSRTHLNECSGSSDLSNASRGSSIDLVESEKSISNSLQTSKGAISNTSLGSSLNMKTYDRYDDEYDDDDDIDAVDEERDGNARNFYDDNDNGGDEPEAVVIQNFDGSTQQIYDICKVETSCASEGEEDETLEETQSIAKTTGMEAYSPDPKCPYFHLPAGHLAIQKSTKYGQLQRIEKRLFFDQSKKCYCGILNDWLLCYMDGPTAAQPSVTLYLKLPGVEVEHYGEGKRRDICFQITTFDPNRRFTFQALNEVDAKEWIHAIEAAIRHGPVPPMVASLNLGTRKLPTPPPNSKRSTFMGSQRSSKAEHKSISSHDSIYEEPWYNIDTHTNIDFTSLIEVRDSDKDNEMEATAQAPILPEKRNSPLAMAQRFEYDIPKIKVTKNSKNNATTVSTDKSASNGSNLKKFIHNSNNYNGAGTSTKGSDKNKPSSSASKSLNGSTSLQRVNSLENLNFQEKIRSIHTKLSSQLNGGQVPNFRKLSRMTSYQVTNQCEATDSLLNGGRSTSLTGTNSSSNSNGNLMEHKKHKKLLSPQVSPNKINVEKSSAKNWILNRLSRNNSMNVRSSGAGCSTEFQNRNLKLTKQGEKQTLLNISEGLPMDSGSDNPDGLKLLLPTNGQKKSHSTRAKAGELLHQEPLTPSSAATSPINLNGAKSKVNQIINQLEARGQLISIFNGNSNPSSMFGALVNGGIGSDYNNYEPIVSHQTSPPPNALKKSSHNLLT